MPKHKIKPMTVLTSDIMQLANENLLWMVVIPTNVGWNREGANVMGAGLARLAAMDDPSLPFWYGDFCKQWANAPEVPVVSRGRFVLFPVKPILRDTPWLSWMQKANLTTVEQSLKSMRRWKRPEGNTNIKLLVPLVGCGNGKLKEAQVMPLLQKYWMNRYRLVRKPADWKPPQGMYKQFPRRR